MNEDDASTLVASFPLDIARVAAARNEPYDIRLENLVASTDSKVEVAAKVLARYEPALCHNRGHLREDRDMQHLAWGLVALFKELGEHETAVRVARWFTDVHETHFELFIEGAEAAAALGWLDEAADLLGVALKKDLYRNFASAKHYLQVFLAEWPQATDAIEGSDWQVWYRILLGTEPPPPDLASEACRVEALWSDDRLRLPDHVRSVLFRFTRDEALALLETPPLNPIDYWFSPSYQDRTNYPHPEAGARLLHLLEVLVACGHASWVADQLPRAQRQLQILLDDN